MNIKQARIGDILHRKAPRPGERRKPLPRPSFQWFDEIDIDYAFNADGTAIETHSNRCHCGDCKQVSPGTDPGSSGTEPLTKEQHNA
jgi:hypothetical protein